MTGILRRCVVVQKGMHALYDRIIDKDTKRNLLNWAVTTYHEGRVNLLRFVTTGMPHCCHAAPEAGRAGSEHASWVCDCA